MRNVIIGAVVVVLLSGFACGSLTLVQLPLSEEPLNLVEAGTGTQVQDVLIVPVYSASVGIALGGGHGPSRISHEESLEAPFAYRHGDPFKLTRPRAFGFLLGPGLLFIGRANTIKGVVAVSRRHRALWVWALWERSLGAPFEMQPLEEPQAYRKWLLALFDGDLIKGSDLREEDQRSFSLIPDHNITVKFSAADRKMVREFLTSGLQ